MKIIKSGTYEHELVGTCARCGQVQECDKYEVAHPLLATPVTVYGARCSLCGRVIAMEEKLRGDEELPDKMELMAFLDLRKFHSVGAISEALLEAYDIRRKS